MNRTKHCWHLTGGGASSDSGGSRDFRCCYCGLRAAHMYRRDHEPIQGHGPLHTRTREVITSPLPDEECRVRIMDNMEVEQDGDTKDDQAHDLDV